MTGIVILLVIWCVLGPFVIRSGLKRRVETLEAQVKALRAAAKGPEAADNLAAARFEAIPEPTAARRAAVETAPEPASADIPPAPPKITAAGRPTWEAVERWLVQRWIIAAGGLTASLGGLFIVRYSIERGLLGPAARIVLGGLAGVALISAAEWVRRRALRSQSGTAAPQAVAALSSAGWVTLYGDFYAAHAFYHFIPGPVAFALLAVVAFGSLAAGLLYGPLAAALGAGMGLLAPALVASDEPNAAILFPYLLVVTSGIFALVRSRPWPWLAWMALAGNGLWQLSWMASAGGQQPLPRVAHLLAIPALSALVLLRERWPEPEQPWWGWDWTKAPLPVWTVGATVLGSFALLWLLAAGTGYDGVAAAGWAAGLALLMLLAIRAPTQQPLLPVAAMLSLGLAAAWKVPAMTPDSAMPWLLRGPPLAPALAPALVAYVAPVAGYAALFGVGGFALMWRSSRPGLWASVSAGVPPILLAILYARLSGLAQSPPWAGVAILLAALALLAAERTQHHNQRHKLASNAPLAAYAAAVTASIALAAAMALHAAWLTVALAVELPALAWIHRRTRTPESEIPALRLLAGVIAAILVVRLVFNPYVADYAGDMPILLNWLVYGYGVPALACWLAARWFRSGRRDNRVESLLQATALAFGTALMTLELWHMASGRGALFADNDPPRQVSAVGNGWLALGLILLRLERDRFNMVRDRAWRIIGGVGLGWSLLITLLYANPLWTGFEVGTTHLFNQVLLAYGLPALLLALAAMELARQRLTKPSRFAGGAAIVFSVAAVLLEIRQAFQGSRLDDAEIGQAESYSYSAGLLAVSLGLLAGGIRWPGTDLRLAGFALLALTLGKAFLIDMGSLTGLWRAASFLGLGLCLIGVGYAFQRLQRAAVSTPPPLA